MIILTFLQAVMVVADAKQSLTITGNGDVLEPHDGVIGDTHLQHCVCFIVILRLHYNSAHGVCCSNWVRRLICPGSC